MVEVIERTQARNHRRIVLCKYIHAHVLHDMPAHELLDVHTVHHSHNFVMWITKNSQVPLQICQALGYGHACDCKY